MNDKNPNSLSSADRKLFDAVEARATADVDVAMAAGADPCAVRPSDMYSVLSCAVWNNDLAMVRRLIQAGAKPERSILCELGHAIEQGWDDLAIALIQSGADPNRLNEEDANEAGITPMMLAAKIGRTSVVAALLAAGANPKARSVQDESAVVLAAEGKHREVLKLLLPFATQDDRERIFDPVSYAARMAEATNPLMLLREAAMNGDIVAIKRLIEQGVDVNGRAGFYDPALSEALRQEKWEAADYLQKAGAQLNAPANNPPISWAAMRGNESLVRQFLAEGALVDGPSGAVSTALASAAIQGHAAIAQLLVDSGANVNAIDSDGVSVLRRAKDLEVRRKKPNPVIPILLAAGAKDNPAPARKQRERKKKQ